MATPPASAPTITAATPSVTVSVAPSNAAPITPEIHTSQSTGFVTFHVWGHQLALNPMLCILLIGLTFTFWELWKAQRKPNGFSFWDLIMDTVPGPNATITQRASLIKIAFMLAFGICSWVIIDLQVKGALTADIFGLYLTAVFGTVCAKLFWDKPFDPATISALWGRRVDTQPDHKDHDKDNRP